MTHRVYLSVSARPQQDKSRVASPDDERYCQGRMDKIICVGKNYLEHAKELGDQVPDRPVLFLKPPSVLVQSPGSQTLGIPLPRGRGAIHPECEIALRITTSSGSPAIDAVTLGLDMTLRDLQAQLKKNGHPWELSKVFAGSAILGPWIPFRDFPNFMEVEFSLTVDGKLRQNGCGSEMRLKPEECVSYAAEFFPLREGDVLFTGTPAGVGPVSPLQTAELTWGSRLRYQVEWT